MQFLTEKSVVHVKNTGLRPIFFRSSLPEGILGYRLLTLDIMRTLSGLNRQEWPFHVLFWILLIGSAMVSTGWVWIFPDRGFFFILVTVIIPIYVNALVLVPRYFNRRHWLLYGGLLILLLLAVSAAKALFFIGSFAWAGETFDVGQQFSKWFLRDLRNLDKFVFSGTAWIVYCSFAYRFIKDWFVNERIRRQLIAEKLTMELALLKAQVNPHFLFNTLNNVYALALSERAETTADAVEKLGALMRYGLHDAQADFIRLSQELDYLERYVDMQKLRTTPDRLTVTLRLDVAEISHQKIAPMILLPFIENAFKYGVSTTEASRIFISITYAAGVLSLRVENAIHAQRVNTSDETPSGLGLTNARERLALIYPKRHRLTHGAAEDTYRVELDVTLV